MHYKKEGFPEISELVVCNVKKILPHSIFVEIEEYGKEGMIHISEIAPGRIRNLRDYVKEGKKIVCKVLNIHKEKGHIDLSLRRVNQSQRIRKNTEYKQEIRAEKILENVAKELNTTLDDIYKKAGNSLIKELKIDPKIEKVLITKVKEKIQPPSVIVTSKLRLQSFSSNGIEDIKKVLKSIKKEGVSLSYLGAPNYRLVINAPDYKEAEGKLKEINDSTVKLAKKMNVDAEFKRK